MKVSTLQAAFGSALALWTAQPCSASLHGHRRAHQLFGKKHNHSHGPMSELAGRAEDGRVEKRTVCKLPNDPDLVAVSGAMNGGFAMAPDVACVSDSYCPIACKAGKVMAQWKPNTGYHYPESMYGGLYCDNGTPKKPFSDRPYCVDGTGAVSVINKSGDKCSFCQTVLPGDEGMYIRTDIDDTAVLAVPDASYWAGTSAHYYINPPGVSGEKGCIWGDPSQPVGNWAPYVAGANTDAGGLTYVKLGWNPIFVGSDLARTRPTFGLKVECDGNCNGDCAIDPSKGDGFSVISRNGATGAGNADFCVVTVSKGSKANIVVFNTDGSTGTPKPKPSSAPPSPSPSPSEPASTSTPSSSSSSKSPSSSAASSSSSATMAAGGIFHENGTYTSYSMGSSSPTHGSGSSPTGQATSTGTSQNDAVNAGQPGVAVAGLVVALIAGLSLY